MQQRLVSASRNVSTRSDQAQGGLEPEPPLPEVDLPRDPRVYHPLQRAVHSGAADPLVFVLDQIDEIVCAEMPFLSEEHIDDPFPFARPLATGRREPQ